MEGREPAWWEMRREREDDGQTRAGGASGEGGTEEPFSPQSALERAQRCASARCCSGLQVRLHEKRGELPAAEARAVTAQVRGSLGTAKCAAAR